MPESKLRFVLETNDPTEVVGRFYPDGQQVLNRSVWRGKEPRTCAVTHVASRAKSAATPGPFVFDVEVTYRPPDVVHYVGTTRYEGWQLVHLDCAADGTLLDGRGKPLDPAAPPVYLKFDVFKDIEFNDVDFGEFVEEIETRPTKRLDFESVMLRVQEATHRSGRMHATIHSTFIAPHRNRPMAKILLADLPSQITGPQKGTSLIVVNKDAPHLTHVLYVQIAHLMTDFMEGKISIKSISDGEGVFVELSDVFIDGTGGDSRFGVLHEYLPDTFLDDLAAQLVSVFEVEADVVGGAHCGFYLRRQAPKE